MKQDDFRLLRAYDARRASPNTWLNLVVLREIQGALRNSASNMTRRPLLEPVHADSPEVICLKAERRGLLHRIMPLLPPRDRSLLDVIDHCDFDMSAAAQASRLSPSRFALRKSRLIVRLRKCIEKLAKRKFRKFP